jgi:hypothetical protein
MTVGGISVVGDVVVGENEWCVVGACDKRSGVMKI